MELIITKNKKDLKIDEEITDLYLYRDCAKKTFDVKYNDEKSITLNIEKTFINKFKKQYKFQTKKLYENIIDVILKEGGKEKKGEKTPKENIYIIYEIKDNFLKKQYKKSYANY
jgi:hypothetical protein